MSAISKFSNYSQFKNVDSKLNTMIAFDKSGIPGQVVGSAGSNGLVWVDSDPSSASYWSEFPATQTVDISGNDISDVKDIKIAGTISNNAKLLLNFDINNPAFSMVNDTSSMNIQNGNMNFTSTSGNVLNIYSGNILSIGDSTHASSLVPPSNDNFNRCLQGNGINSKIYLTIPDSNPTIQLSNEVENIYSRSDLTSLYYNNGTIETVKLDSTAGTLTITGTDSSVLSTTDLTFNGLTIKPIPNTFDFMIDGDSYSIPCVSIGKQYTMIPESSFVITTSDNILLHTDFSSNFLSAVIYRDNVFYPLQVDSVSSNIISLSGNFDSTQTVYFSGIIFST